MAQVTTVPTPPITTGRFYFLKGRFKAGSTNLYGLFLVIFNPQKAMESFHAVVSTFSNVYDLEPHIDWHVFEEKITDFRWKGNCNTNLTSAIVTMFDTINKDLRQRDELYGLISSYNYTHLDVSLLDLINRIIRDKMTILETGIQEATPEEVLAVRELHAKKTAETEKSEAPMPTSTFQVEEGALIVSMSMVLSPVSGKLLYELKIGDKIMLRFNPKMELGNYYIDYYNLRTPEGKIKPIPGEVIDIKSESKALPVNILARIDNQLYGVTSEEERHVRVYLYDPKIDGVFKSPAKDQSRASRPARTATASPGSNPKRSSFIFLVMGILAFLLIVLIITIIILI
jgi:hypothetical protein